MVEIETSEQSIGTVVRFKRKAWSHSLQRHYMDTDLIIVVQTSLMADFMADFAIYQQLDEVRQMAILEHLRTARYARRLLRQSDLVVPSARREPSQLCLM